MTSAETITTDSPDQAITGRPPPGRTTNAGERSTEYHPDPKTFAAAVPARFHEGSYHWKYEQVITGLQSGETDPESLDHAEAIALLQERFGCAYGTLAATQKEDPELLMLATVQSAGHALGSAPEETVQHLEADWWIEAVSRGARGWILQYAPLPIRDNPDVVIACVSSCGDAIRYASNRLRADPHVQRAAVQESPKAIEHCLEPPAALVEEVVRRTRGHNGTSHTNGSH